MIETTCKLDLKTIDFIEVECSSCNSQTRVSLKKEQRVEQCPVCNKNFSDITLKAIAHISTTIFGLKNYQSEKISLIKIES